MIKAQLLNEPDLFFGNNMRCIDAKVGLLNFGPNGPFGTGESEKCQVLKGVISTPKSLSTLQTWLQWLGSRIGGVPTSDSNVRGIDFPGLGRNGPLRFDLKIDSSNIETIPQSDIHALSEITDRRQRIKKVMEIYTQAFSDLSSANPPCKLVLLPISDELITLCKDPRFRQEKIVFDHRTFENEEIDNMTFDFHHALKVVSFKYQKVCQLILPSTLQMQMGQDPATMAWNFAVAAYYKGTGVPWKLANIEENTCYVGLSFFQEIHKDHSAMRSSMAHVYLRTGESQVIRGKPFVWDDTKGREPHLSSDHANDVLTDVIALFRRQKGRSPSRIVVHKTSPYTPDEILGFNDATNGIELVDYVHVYDNVYTRFYAEKSKYPPVRGTMIYNEGMSKDIFLFTTGFIPALGSYSGISIPIPLRLTTYRLDTNIQQISEDIMALSKLDWNSADFCKRLPVTIAASRKVGDVLSEMRAYDIKDPPQDYRYYM